MYVERIKDSLETPRLRLRKFKRSDWEAVYKYGSDPRVLKYLEWAGVTTKQEAMSSIYDYYFSKFNDFFKQLLTNLIFFISLWDTASSFSFGGEIFLSNSIPY